MLIKFLNSEGKTMYIICEQPWTQQQLGFLARKNGEYTRPIVGAAVDFKIEDMNIPKDLISSIGSFNFIGRLPDIKDIDQVDKFFICTQNNITTISASEAEAMALVRSGHYILLPDSPKSELWKYTNSPWWEYGFVLDKYFEYIKAPKFPRPGEPTPEEIDEHLDDFAENRGSAFVTSPVKLLMGDK